MTSYEDAIFAAAKTGSVEDIQELLKTNVNWNTKDSLGNTPVHYAAGTLSFFRNLTPCQRLQWG
jgi:ankyrin repeat protein